jgi:alpha-tubulin suppressor-like RCC1 family protein
MASGFSTLSQGYRSTLILKTDGSVWGTGYNHYGVLGVESIARSESMIDIYSSNVVMVDIDMPSTNSTLLGGRSHAVVKNDGSLWVSGRNNFGQLGNGTISNVFSPIQLLLSGVATVSSGTEFNAILKTDGSLWTMGKNDQGQLGNGNFDPQLTPVKIVTSGVKSIYTSQESLFFIKTDGSLWAMGLGFGNTPKQIMK